MRYVSTVVVFGLAFLAAVETNAWSLGLLVLALCYVTFVEGRSSV